jgi:hypothetical protein
LLVDFVPIRCCSTNCPKKDCPPTLPVPHPMIESVAIT